LKPEGDETMKLDNPLAEKELVGGALCLDFANTVGQHAPEVLSEWLHGYDDLAWWAHRASMVDDDGARALFDAARARPDEAARVFERAVALREAIYRLFSAAGAGEDVSADDLARLNDELARALPHLRVVRAGEGFGYAWEGDGLDRMLWPVVRSAAELLTEGDLSRIGECAGEHCQWLYLDTSRNHSRRWCVMSDCGNRAKARRHYHRTKSATA
jgi:predicted RNA-binding Zn ribbon-like protein